MVMSDRMTTLLIFLLMIHGESLCRHAQYIRFALIDVLCVPYFKHLSRIKYLSNYTTHFYDTDILCL